MVHDDQKKEIISHIWFQFENRLNCKRWGTWRSALLKKIKINVKDCLQCIKEESSPCDIMISLLNTAGKKGRSLDTTHGKRET